MTLRILIESRRRGERSAVVLRLEGAISGPWVSELADCWQSFADGSSLVEVDLADVPYISPEGRDLLRRIHRTGTLLSAADGFNRATLAELTREDGLS